MARALFRSLSKNDTLYKLLLINIRKSNSNPNRFYSASFSELSKIIDQISDVCFSVRFLNREKYANAKSFEICTLKYDTVSRKLNTDAGHFGNDDKVMCTSMKRLFEKTIYNIQNSTNTNRYEQALSKLNNFLDNQDYHEDCFARGIQNDFERMNVESLDHPRFQVPESLVAVLLVVHLLSQLTVTNGQSDTCYIVSDTYRNDQDYCPCNRCGTEIVYGSTGSEDSLIDQPHICLLPNDTERMVNVVYTGNNVKNVQERKKNRRDGIISNKQKSGPSLSHIAAETILLSFYNMKESEEGQTWRPSLIPSVAISEKGFDICMYDSVNDIFIKNHGPPIPLFDYSGQYFQKSSIIYLWLVINHSIFQPHFYQSDVRKMKGTFGLFSRYVDENMYERIIQNVRGNVKLSENYDSDEADRNEYDIIFLDDPEFDPVLDQL